ncbi:hypothetical protein AGOR_G00194480 [Albula goreensis]|uniref:Ig-like domain-containing protein n=1 Tax=Albula goreensis TaxID=1534307 RepID=A0A8T3CVP8_9TELE|nr:hypothetical protein AGOR_G00194480 [Albula goreensis]
MMMINLRSDFLLLLGLVAALLRAEQPRVETAREGQAITLHPHFAELQASSYVIWSFYHTGSFKVIAESFSGEITTDFIQRFRDRLQVDGQTGSLSISKLGLSDSGVYLLQTEINGDTTLLRFQLTVYAPVLKPVITNINSSHSGSENCSVLCSVENGREVTLSWQREGETLNTTSSPDLNTPLSLPLEIEENSAPYSCVAANPVCNQTVRLNTSELCPQTAVHTCSVQCCRFTEFVVRLVLSGLVSVVLAVLLVHHFKHR